MCMLTLSHACRSPHRIRRTLGRLDTSLAAVSLDDPRDQKCFDDLEDIRAKMRLVELWLRGPTRLGYESAAPADAAASSCSSAPASSSGTEGALAATARTADLDF